MLYQTHPLLSSISPSATTSCSSFLLSPSLSFSSSLQVEKRIEMECVEAALRTSFRKEMAFKFSPQAAFLDDSYTLNNAQNVTSCDEFIVDELLDFSNEEEEELELEDDEKEQKQKPCPVFVSVSVSQQTQQPENDKIGEDSPNFSTKYDFGSVPASELCVPADDLASLDLPQADDLASLEWLSHFVEDSNSEYSAPFPAGLSLQEPKEENNNNKNNLCFVPVKPDPTETFFKTPVPAKARSKRTRTGGRVWSLGSPSLTESSSSSSTSSSSSSSSSSPSTSCLIFTTPGMNHELTQSVFFEKPPVKKQKKRYSGEVASGGGVSQPPRRCSHCGVQKTPQWRAGPLGAKTLCNACGVRFKSGRLLPEYRPACSPTYSSELHSNHHRKVLEMRKKKEAMGQSEPGLATPAVPSF